MEMEVNVCINGNMLFPYCKCSELITQDKAVSWNKWQTVILPGRRQLNFCKIRFQLKRIQWPILICAFACTLEISVFFSELLHWSSSGNMAIFPACYFLPTSDSNFSSPRMSPNPCAVAVACYGAFIYVLCPINWALFFLGISGSGSLKFLKNSYNN